MLLPLLLLSWAWGALAASPPLPTESLVLRLLLTSLFPNASAVTVAAKVLLGDLETHTLDSRTGAIRFLQPWARGGLSPREWQDLERVAAQSLADFIQKVTGIAREQGIDYPFVAQASIGCELHPNGTSQGFYDVASNGQAVVSFDAEAGTWVARSADGLARYIQDLLSGDWSTSTRLQYFLKISCIYVLQTFARHGNASLARRERPITVVFAREPPPASPPASLLLVCRVTGFYPRPVHVAWLQDGEEVGPGRRLDSSGTLPNADLTYQLRSSLAVGPGDGHSYACRVEHSSLEGWSLLIPWGQSWRWGPGLAAGIALGALAIAMLAMLLWRCRRRVYQEVGPASGDTSSGVGTGPSPGDLELVAGSGPGSRVESPTDGTGSERCENGALGAGWDSPPAGTLGAHWTLGGIMVAGSQEMLKAGAGLHHSINPSGGGAGFQSQGNPDNTTARGMPGGHS